MFALYAICEGPGYNNTNVREVVFVGSYPTRDKAKRAAAKYATDEELPGYVNEFGIEILYPEHHISEFEIKEIP